MTSKQKKIYKVQLIVSCSLFFALYMTLFIYTAIKYSIFEVCPTEDGQFPSLSRIGWYWGGVFPMIAWVVLSMPVLFYQAVVFSRLSRVRDWKLLVLSGFSALLIIAGISMPVGTAGTTWSRFLHSIFCQFGSILMIASVCYTIYLYCVEHKDAKTKRILVAIICLLVATLVSFTLLWTAAAFQMPAMFIYVLVSFAINFAMLHRIYRAGESADRSKIVDRKTSRKVKIMWWIAVFVIVVAMVALFSLAISKWYYKPYG